jgi:hypothetical protein
MFEPSTFRNKASSQSGVYVYEKSDAKFNLDPEIGYRDEAFRDIPQSPSRRILGKYLKIKQRQPSSKPFPICNSLITLSFDAI